MQKYNGENGFALFIVLGLMVLATIAVVGTHKAVSHLDNKSASAYYYTLGREAAQSGIHATVAYMNYNSYDIASLVNSYIKNKRPVRIPILNMDSERQSYHVYLMGVSVDGFNDFIPDSVVFNEYNLKKDSVCHLPVGDISRAKTLSIGSPAYSSHIGHGDPGRTCDELENLEFGYKSLHNISDGIYIKIASFGKAINGARATATSIYKLNGIAVDYVSYTDILEYVVEPPETFDNRKLQISSSQLMIRLLGIRWMERPDTSNATNGLPFIQLRQGSDIRVANNYYTNVKDAMEGMEIEPIVNFAGGNESDCDLEYEDVYIEYEKDYATWMRITADCFYNGEKYSDFIDTRVIVGKTKWDLDFDLDYMVD